MQGLPPHYSYGNMVTRERFQKNVNIWKHIFFLTDNNSETKTSSFYNNRKEKYRNT